MPNLNPPRLQQRGLPAELDKWNLDIATAVNSALVKGDTYRVFAPYTAKSPLVVPSDWHNVQGGVGFQNSWTDYDAGVSWAQASYKKDVLGFVHIRGHIKGGGNTTVFTLPSGYRPAKNEQFGIMFNNLWALALVDTSGNVTVSQSAGVAPFASLAGITFQSSDFLPYVPSCFPFDLLWTAPAAPSLVLAQVQDVANAAAPANLATCNVDWLPINQAGAVSTSPSLIRIRNIPNLQPGSYAVQVVALV